MEILRTDFMDAEEGRIAANDEDGDDVFMFTDGETLRMYQARLTDQGTREWVRVKVLPEPEPMPDTQ